jgi:flagellar motor switch protein FliM
MKRQLSQEEIDEYFQSPGGGENGGDPAYVPFDFRRLDRIPKSQLGIIRFLHETFVRTLSASLSVYLRSYVYGDLIKVEQLPYGDFAERLSSPTCIACLSMQPYDGCSLVEVNQNLLATILDHVLGGNGKMPATMDREITDIEQDMLEGFYRIIARDLSEAWKPIAPLRFAVDSLETTPQPSKRIARNEAVVAVAMELRISDNTGVVNLAIPCITLKAMRQQFDQQWTHQKVTSQATAMAIQKKLSRELMLNVEFALSGADIRVRDLLNLESGDVLDLGMPVDSAITALVNGQPHFQGEMVTNGSRTAMVVRSVTQP